MNRIRKSIMAYTGKQACIAVCIILLAAMAGLFSSCERKAMGDRPQIQTDELPGALTAPSAASPAISLSPGQSVAPPQTAKPETSASAEQPPAPSPSPSPKPTSTPKPTPTPSATPKPTQAPSPSAKPAASPIVNPYVRYTWDQMTDEAAKLQERYPDLISLSSAGQSVEGRDLLLIKLGTGEKKIFLCGAHHAREYISSTFLMKMTETYADYASRGAKFGNYNVRDLLSKVTVYIVPMVNPDGVNLVNRGIDAVGNQEAVSAMAMVHDSYREWKANIDGVDLNRQYPAYWDEKYDNVGVPASENYKGAASATEPEVKAMIALSEENDFILSASFHSKGNVIYWADSGTVNLMSGVKDIARGLSSLTGYDLMPISQKPSVYGAGFENWFRLEFKRPSFCIELTYSNETNLPHNDNNFDSLVWKKAKYIGLFLAEEALKR